MFKYLFSVFLILNLICCSDNTEIISEEDKLNDFMINFAKGVCPDENLTKLNYSINENNEKVLTSKYVCHINEAGWLDSVDNHIYNNNAVCEFANVPNDCLFSKSKYEYFDDGFSLCVINWDPRIQDYVSNGMPCAFYEYKDFDYYY